MAQASHWLALVQEPQLWEQALQTRLSAKKPARQVFTQAPLSRRVLEVQAVQLLVEVHVRQSGEQGWHFCPAGKVALGQVAQQLPW